MSAERNVVLYHSPGGEQGGRGMTTYRIEGEHLTTAQIAARCPGINPNTIASRLLRGYRTWAELRLSKADTLRKSKARFKSWNIQPKQQIPA